MVQCRCSTRSPDLARLLVYLEPGTARSRAPWKVGVTWAIQPDDVPATAGCRPPAASGPVPHYCRPMLFEEAKRPRGQEEGDLVARAQPSPKVDQPLPPFPPIPNRSKPETITTPIHGRRWRRKTQRESLYHFSSIHLPDTTTVPRSWILASTTTTMRSLADAEPLA